MKILNSHRLYYGAILIALIISNLTIVKNQITWILLFVESVTLLAFPFYLSNSKPLKFKKLHIFLSLIPFALWWLIVPEAESGRRLLPEYFLIPAHWFWLLAVYHLYTLKNGGDIRWVIMAIFLSFGFSAYLLETYNWLLYVLMLVNVMIILYHENQMRISSEIKYKINRESFLWILLIVVIVIFSISLQSIRKSLQRDWSNRYLKGYNESIVKGFNSKSMLGGFANEWNLKEDKKIVLRIWSQARPGYLQGGEYRRYQWGVWSEDLDWKTLNSRGQIVDHGVYSLNQTQSAKDYQAIVYPEVISSRYFVPHQTAQIASLKDSLHANVASIFKPIKGRISNRGYYYYSPDERLKYFNQPDTLDLSVPEILHPHLDSILVHIKQKSPELKDWIIGSNTLIDSTSNSVNIGNSQKYSREIVRAIYRWYLSEFEYSLESKWSLKEEPVLQFLERKKGYCEFFASTATLLLRRAGVPARYIKGFSPPEKLGDAWVVRRANAHAWIKYWKTSPNNSIRENNWVIAEMTPPDYRPNSYLNLTASEKLKENWSGKIKRFFSIIREGQWRTEIRKFENRINELFQDSKLMLVISLTLFFGLIFWKRKSLLSVWENRRQNSLDRQKQSQKLKDFRQKSKMAESILSDLGFRRHRWQALGNYISDLDSKIEWNKIPVEKKSEIQAAIQTLKEYWEFRFSKKDI